MISRQASVEERLLELLLELEGTGEMVGGQSAGNLARPLGQTRLVLPDPGVDAVLVLAELPLRFLGDV